MVVVGDAGTPGARRPRDARAGAALARSEVVGQALSTVGGGRKSAALPARSSARNHPQVEPAASVFGDSLALCERAFEHTSRPEATLADTTNTPDSWIGTIRSCAHQSCLITILHPLCLEGVAGWSRERNRTRSTSAPPVRPTRRRERLALTRGPTQCERPPSASAVDCTSSSGGPARRLLHSQVADALGRHREVPHAGCDGGHLGDARYTCVLEQRLRLRYAAAELGPRGNTTTEAMHPVYAVAPPRGHLRTCCARTAHVTPRYPRRQGLKPSQL